MGVHVCGETLHLLVKRLCQRLPLGRYAGIDGCAHGEPPSVVCEVVWGEKRGVARRGSSKPGGIDRLGPTVVPRPLSAGIAAVSASGVS